MGQGDNRQAIEPANSIVDRRRRIDQSPFPDLGSGEECCLHQTNSTIALAILRIPDGQASEESISVGRKCLRANVLLPEPLGPMRMTKDRLGMVMDI
jgi:hypothetical protein